MSAFTLVQMRIGRGPVHRYEVRRSEYGEHIARDVANMACAAENRRLAAGNLDAAELHLDDGGTPSTDHYPPTYTEDEEWESAGFKMREDV